MASKRKFPTFQIDLSAGTPAYLQIMLQIQSLILGGEIQPGEQLPTVRQLAAELAINFNTVARAYRLLGHAGLITTQQGRGTFVLESAGAQLKLREDVLHELTEQYLLQVSRLDYSASDVVVTFRRHIEEWIKNESIKPI